MISIMRARGDRVFCADARGDYLRRFYRPGDLILNPSDQRSVSWSPLAEIHSRDDAAAIARSLIPDSEGEDGKWTRYAQQLTEGVLLHALDQRLNNAEIVRLALHAEVAELRDRLRGLPGAGLLPEKSDNTMFHDTRGTASPYLDQLNKLDPKAGGGAFSLRSWARDESSRAAAWFNYQDVQISKLRTLIATQFDLLCLGTLEQDDSRDRRTWLVIDELPALGRVASLEDFLSRARKAGGAAVLGLQSLVQLRRLYGEHSASAIIACTSNLLALALGDAESQEYVSKLFGEQEHSVVTRSASQSDAAAQQTVQRQLRTERVVMPSELSPGQLKSRHGFLRLPELPIAPARLEIQDFPDVAPRFLPREGPQDPRAMAPEDTPATSGAGAAAAETAPDTAPYEQAAEPSPLAPDASPEDLLDHLEARRQAGWREAQRSNPG